MVQSQLFHGNGLCLSKGVSMQNGADASGGFHGNVL